ncbi:50S ribosomal protein L3 N(5)-glutamine methyltransferase [uncultured Umboniibacter sp.]|uniref:50S ribosomal protein L3 N(5)-glutamine methyltransferase n=1 Tax=uncultured Umboniibacter sp. TaxID=1798917 RepID=UPI00263113F8|nr:50S ribosomal protein L3 N(5)-glutamine methyltransferase [uncultured Umboniibacter sp.]
MQDSIDSLVTELITVRDYIRWGATSFERAGLYFGHGTDNAWDDAVQIVLHTLNLPPESDQMVLDARLVLSERKQVLKLLSRRAEERVPTPYLLGYAWFCGMRFKVDERVLIPRSPIAELIESGFQPWLVSEPKRILDLCTGSGCIGLACADSFPHAEVDLADISTDALAVAAENIAWHQMGHRVVAVNSDLFDSLTGRKYDIIVSNPPYVDAQDMSDLPAEYHHEPELALAAGNDGLDLVRRILIEAPKHLSEEGILICELGNSWVHLQDAYPEIPFTWLEFERGGHGVFLLTAGELLAHKDAFSTR